MEVEIGSVFHLVQKFLV